MKLRPSATPAATLVWFKNDLRLADNPALHAAARQGQVVPIFIWSPEEEGASAPGGASKWWLHHSLKALGTSLCSLGSSLIIRRGPALNCLRHLLQETGARSVFWNRCYEPLIAARDAEIQTALQQEGVSVQTFNASLLFEPGTILNKSGKPFQVFTPFWKTCLNHEPPHEPSPAPRTLAGSKKHLKSLPLDVLELQPAIPWASGFEPVWSPGEAGAIATLKDFCGDALLNYNEGRNRPDLPGTSRLSPHLHFGEISPHQVWSSLQRWCGHHAPGQRQPVPSARIKTTRLKDEESKASLQSLLDSQLPRGTQFLTELGWREFAHHLLYHFSHTITDPLRPEFARFPWHEDNQLLKAWQKGLTGFPIVDAGMRQLWATGWMHNRVRMIVASFLVKDLLIPWQRGAAWFWDTLVDADLANNTLGWQWTAGCGADAAPFFRIFNPTSQGEKFDPRGDYVRQWVPELARLPANWIHQPWAAPAAILQAASVQIGCTYPERIINHATAREVALEAYKTMKSKPNLAPGKSSR